MRDNQTNQVNEIISKSLDEIEAMAKDFENNLSISKAQGDEDLSAGQVSEDAPTGDEGEGEEPTQDADTDTGEGGEPTGDEGEEPTDTDEGDTDNDSEGEEDEAEDEEVEKSLSSIMNSKPDVKKALEVSEFLNELVKSLDTVLNTHNDGLQKSMQASEQSNDLLAKSLLGLTKAHQTIMKSQSELHKSVQEINKRLDSISQQPVVRKSVASSVQPIQKSFEASQGNAPQAPTNDTLSKAEISSKLMTAFNSGNKDIMPDILAFEGTGNVNALSPEAKAIIGQ